MNKRIVLFIATACYAIPSFACDDSFVFGPEEMAMVTVLGLITLSALLIPATALLQNQNTTPKQLLVIYGLVITGLIASGILFYFNGHRYMRPGAVALGFLCLFIPVAVAFFKSVKTFRQRRQP